MSFPIWMGVLIFILVAAAFLIIMLSPMPLDDEDLDDWDRFLEGKK